MPGGRKAVSLFAFRVTGSGTAGYFYHSSSEHPSDYSSCIRPVIIEGYPDSAQHGATRGTHREIAPGPLPAFGLGYLLVYPTKT